MAVDLVEFKEALQEKHFRGMDCRGQHFTPKSCNDLVDFFFEGTDLEGAVFENIILKNVKIEYCSLKSTIFRNVSFEDCVIVNCSLEQSLFDNTKIINCDFRSCDATSVDFNFVYFYETVFSEIRLHNSRFLLSEDVDLSIVSFMQCDIQHSLFCTESKRFFWIELLECNLSYSVFEDIYFAAATFSFFYCNLKETSITRCDFEEATSITGSGFLNSVRSVFDSTFNCGIEDRETREFLQTVNSIRNRDKRRDKPCAYDLSLRKDILDECVELGMDYDIINNFIDKTGMEQSTLKEGSTFGPFYECDEIEDINSLYARVFCMYVKFGLNLSRVPIEDNNDFYSMSPDCRKFSNYSQYTWNNPRFKNVTLEEDLNGYTFIDAMFLSCDFQQTSLNKTRFVASNMERSVFTNVNLQNSSFENANLIACNFEGANLRGANLEGANLERSTLRGATLVGANLRGANLNLARLEGADLTGADLTDALMPRTWKTKK